MKIDPGTIFTAILFLLACSIPFILLSRSNRKREKKILQLLTGVARENNYKISQYNTWGNTAIGMDDMANVIFFTKTIKDIETAQQVTLAETEKCRVLNTSRTERNKDENYTITDKLELVFASKNKGNEETVLEFFNAGYDGAILTGELQLAEKWCRIINDKITASAQKK